MEPKTIYYSNDYSVLSDMSLLPCEKRTVDLYCGEEKWILLRGGNRLEYCLGDHTGIILLNQNDTEEDTNGKYKSSILHDDGMSYPAYVAFKYADTLEELKEITEKEIKKRENISGGRTFLHQSS